LKSSFYASENELKKLVGWGLFGLTTLSTQFGSYCAFKVSEIDETRWLEKHYGGLETDARCKL